MNIKDVIKKSKLYKVYSQLKQEKRLNDRKKIINEYGGEVICEIEKALGNSGLTYFATCGTLLGLIRENNLLKNDYDLDYALLINSQDDWCKLENVLNKIGYKKIRLFTLKDNITEQTYRNNVGVEIDFFGNFNIDDELCFYSYDKLQNVIYPSERLWTVYIIKNGKFCGVKKITSGIGEVTVPQNAEENLKYIYNDDWGVPDPDFKANTGKGCSLLKGEYGEITMF